MRRQARRLVSSATAGALLAMLLVGCSSGQSSSPMSPTSAAPSFNDADVRFVVDAGTHLTATLSAAQLADGRSTSPDVAALAAKIIALRGPEVDTVAGWVRTWGRQGADLAHDSLEQSQQEQTGGLSAEAMSKLSALSGRRFDRLFLSTLLKHLAQGRTIWSAEVRQGIDPEATRLADEIAQEESRLESSAHRLLRASSSEP